jgi:hypothetical protein
MSDRFNPRTDQAKPMVYQIRLKGHLGHKWTDWFEGLTITLEDSGDTLLSGLVADQAALYGLLRKARDLGMPLVAVNCVEPDQEEAPGERLTSLVSKARWTDSREENE